MPTPGPPPTVPTDILHEVQLRESSSRPLIGQMIVGAVRTESGFPSPSAAAGGFAPTEHSFTLTSQGVIPSSDRSPCLVTEVTNEGENLGSPHFTALVAVLVLVFFRLSLWQMMKSCLQHSLTPPLLNL